MSAQWSRFFFFFFTPQKTPSFFLCEKLSPDIFISCSRNWKRAVRKEHDFFFYGYPTLLYLNRNFQLLFFLSHFLFFSHFPYTSLNQIKMPALGRTSSVSSVSSNSSTCSIKSVSFGEMDTVFYTHGEEYDRTAAEEPRHLRPSLGQIYLSKHEQADIQNSLQDSMVERNTFANGRRNSAGYAVVLTLRSRSL